MKKIMLTMLAAASIWSSAWAAEKTFSSPDGKLTVTVDDLGNAASYQVKLEETEMVCRSPL